jgi:hypothetical protein
MMMIRSRGVRIATRQCLRGLVGQRVLFRGTFHQFGFAKKHNGATTVLLRDVVRAHDNYAISNHIWVRLPTNGSMPAALKDVEQGQVMEFRATVKEYRAGSQDRKTGIITRKDYGLWKPDEWRCPERDTEEPAPVKKAKEASLSPLARVLAKLERRKQKAEVRRQQHEAMRRKKMPTFEAAQQTAA